eukprot:Lankesteria_metandrocarpae@DN4788_c0_g1_i2.p1
MGESAVVLFKELSEVPKSCSHQRDSDEDMLVSDDDSETTLVDQGGFQDNDFENRSSGIGKVGSIRTSLRAASSLGSLEGDTMNGSSTSNALHRTSSAVASARPIAGSVFGMAPTNLKQSQEVSALRNHFLQQHVDDRFFPVATTSGSGNNNLLQTNVSSIPTVATPTAAAPTPPVSSISSSDTEKSFVAPPWRVRSNESKTGSAAPNSMVCRDNCPVAPALDHHDANRCDSNNSSAQNAIRFISPNQYGSVPPSGIASRQLPDVVAKLFKAAQHNAEVTRKSRFDMPSSSNSSSLPVCGSYDHGGLVPPGVKPFFVKNDKFTPAVSLAISKRNTGNVSTCPSHQASALPVTTTIHPSMAPSLSLTSLGQNRRGEMFGQQQSSTLSFGPMSNHVSPQRTPISTATANSSSVFNSNKSDTNSSSDDSLAALYRNISIVNTTNPTPTTATMHTTPPGVTECSTASESNVGNSSTGGSFIQPPSTVATAAVALGLEAQWRQHQLLTSPAAFSAFQRQLAYYHYTFNNANNVAAALASNATRNTAAFNPNTYFTSQPVAATTAVAANTVVASQTQHIASTSSSGLLNGSFGGNAVADTSRWQQQQPQVTHQPQLQFSHNANWRGPKPSSHAVVVSEAVSNALARLRARQVSATASLQVTSNVANTNSINNNSGSSTVHASVAGATPVHFGTLKNGSSLRSFLESSAVGDAKSCEDHKRLEAIQKWSARATEARKDDVKGGGALLWRQKVFVYVKDYIDKLSCHSIDWDNLPVPTHINVRNFNCPNVSLGFQGISNDSYIPAPHGAPPPQPLFDTWSKIRTAAKRCRYFEQGPGDALTGSPDGMPTAGGSASKRLCKDRMSSVSTGYRHGKRIGHTSSGRSTSSSSSDRSVDSSRSVSSDSGRSGFANKERSSAGKTNGSANKKQYGITKQQPRQNYRYSNTAGMMNGVDDYPFQWGAASQAELSKRRERGNRFLPYGSSGGDSSTESPTSSTTTALSGGSMFGGSAVNKFQSRGVPRLLNWQEKLQLMGSIKRVTGLSTAVEKQYLRLCGPADPAMVRPLSVLKRSFAYVVDKYESKGSSWSYLEEQLRSIRQDLMVQRIADCFTIEVYELNARKAIVNGDLGQFNACQAQLPHLYEANGRNNSNSNRLEFFCYRLVYMAIQSMRLDLLKQVAELTEEEMSATEIKFAVAVWRSISECNFRRYFLLLKQSPYLAGDLMQVLNAKYRLLYLVAITKGHYTATVPFLCKVLAFSSEADCCRFLDENGAVWEQDNSTSGVQKLNCKKSFIAFSASPILKQRKMKQLG